MSVMMSSDRDHASPYLQPAPAKRRRLDTASAEDESDSVLEPTTPTTPPVPAPTSTKVAQKKPKIDASIRIEDAYPELFLPLTRENVLINYNEPSLKTVNHSYSWKKNSPPIEEREFWRMRILVADDAAKHFIAFNTARGACWAIKTRFPTLDCSTEAFRVLRRYFVRGCSDLKHEFLYDRLFTYLLLTRHQNPDVVKMSDLELIQFLGHRFDVPLVKLLWGKCTRVLDINQTFADHEALGAWYLRQVFLNMSTKILPLINSEVALNPNRKWPNNGRAPSGWNLDRKRRDEANKFFETLCVASEFSDVELDSFKWMPDQPPPETTSLRKPKRGISHFAAGMFADGTSDQ
ncbi:hypothetical protein GGS21DRAFT_93804 [Xylaria nigripes]|nr:hypothetical protein GGS21DRAFT_93804 [Xylaria nigripes]